MGMYDSVWVECPNCKTETDFQSKSGDCILAFYTLENCPKNVMKDINRHAPETCEKCQTKFKVDIENRKAVVVI